MYDVRKNDDGKYEVVEASSGRVCGTYDNEQQANDRVEDLDFRAEIRQQLKRLPGQELTIEEKAAEYDRIMAEKNKVPGQPGQPGQPNDDPRIPPKKTKPATEPKKRDAYWGDSLGDGA